MICAPQLTDADVPAAAQNECLFAR